MTQPLDDKHIDSRTLEENSQPELIVDDVKEESVRHSSELHVAAADSTKTEATGPTKASDIVSFYFMRMISTFLDLIYSGIILGICSLFLIFIFVLFGKAGPEHHRFVSQTVYLISLLALPFVDAQLYFKLQGKGRFTTPGKSGSSFFLVKKDGKELDKGLIITRSYAKYGLLALSLYLTSQLQLPVFVIPFLMFNRRFIHDYIVGTQVVGVDEDPVTTFYPRGSVWTKVILTWVALTLFLLPFKWEEIERRAMLLYSEHFATDTLYKLEAVETVLYPGFKDGEYAYRYSDASQVLLMSRLALHSSVSGQERLRLLNDAIALRIKYRKENVITGSDLTRMIELNERAQLAYYLKDSRALQYFNESMKNMLYSPGDKFGPDANPFIMYARLLSENGQFHNARAQIDEYRFALKPEEDPSREECEKTLRYIDELQKQRTK